MSTLKINECDLRVLNALNALRFVLKGEKGL